MGLVTALSRLTLFLGVKRLGSMQTALLGVLEVIVSIVLAILFLGERLTAVQWLGALLLIICVLLVRYERNVPKFIDWWQIILRRRAPTSRNISPVGRVKYVIIAIPTHLITQTSDEICSSDVSMHYTGYNSPLC